MTGKGLALEDFLNETKSIRAIAADAGTDAFFALLPGDRLPDEKDLQTAARRTEASALDAAGETFARLSEGREISEDDAGLFILRLQEHLPLLSTDALPLSSEIPPLRIACAAAGGALLGMGILSPLTALFFGSREAGFLAGAPLGSLLLSLAAIHLPRSRKLLWSLAAILGLGTLREALAFLGSGNIFSGGWSMLRKKRGTLSRLLLFPVLLGLILLLGKRTSGYDRKTWESAVRDRISSWVESAARITFLLRETVPQASSAGESGLSSLAAGILALENVPSEYFRPGIAELAQEVRNLGFGREQREDLFQWTAADGERFEVFGHAGQGDLVKVERLPLLRDGTVVSRGLVRKVRRS